jgi:hypothetical protein
MKNIILNEEEKNRILNLYTGLLNEGGGGKEKYQFLLDIGGDEVFKFIDNTIFRSSDEGGWAISKELDGKGIKVSASDLTALAKKNRDELLKLTNRVVSELTTNGLKTIRTADEKALARILEKLKTVSGKNMSKDDVAKVTAEQIEKASDSVLNKKSPNDSTKTISDDVIDSSTKIFDEMDGETTITRGQFDASLKTFFNTLYKKATGKDMSNELLNNILKKFKETQKYKDMMETYSHKFDVDDVTAKLDQEIEDYGLPLLKDKSSLSNWTKLQYFFKNCPIGILKPIFEWGNKAKFLEFLELIIKGLKNTKTDQSLYYDKLKEVRKIMNSMAEIKTNPKNLSKNQVNKQLELFKLQLEKEFQTIKDVRLRIQNTEKYVDDPRIYQLYEQFELALTKGANDGEEGYKELLNWFKEVPKGATDSEKNISKLAALEEIFETVVTGRKDVEPWWNDVFFFLKAFKREGIEEITQRTEKTYLDDPAWIKKMYEYTQELGDIVLDFAKSKEGGFVKQVIRWVTKIFTIPLGNILTKIAPMLLDYARNGIFTSPKIMEKMFFKYGYPGGWLVLCGRWLTLFTIVLPFLGAVKDYITLITASLPDFSNLATSYEGGIKDDIEYTIRVGLEFMTQLFMLGPWDMIKTLWDPKSQIELAAEKDYLLELREKSFWQPFTERVQEALPGAFQNMILPVGEFLIKPILYVYVGGKYYVNGSISDEDKKRLSADYTLIKNPTNDFIIKEIFNVSELVKFSKENKDGLLGAIENLKKETEKLKQNLQNKAEKQTEKVLNNTNKIALSKKLDNARENIDKYEPTYITDTQYKLLCDKTNGLLQINPKFLEKLTSATNEDEEQTAQSSISMSLRLNNDVTDPETAPIGVMIGKEFYPYIDNYGMIRQAFEEGKRVSTGQNDQNYFAPHFYNPKEGVFMSMKYTVLKKGGTDEAKIQILINSSIKSENISDDVIYSLGEVEKALNYLKKLKEYIDFWELKLIEFSHRGQKLTPKRELGKNYTNRFETSRNKYNEYNDLYIDSKAKILDTIKLCNDNIKKFTIWTNSKTNANYKKDKVSLDQMIQTIELLKLNFEIVNQSVPTGEKTKQGETSTDVMHTIPILVLSTDQKTLFESIYNKKHKIINEMRNTKKQYLLEDEERFGENKFDHWYDTFTFEKYDEKNNEFKEIETDTLKHGKIKNRFSDFIKNYDGDDAFVRAVIDTHPEIVRFRYLKDQADINESYTPIGLGLILQSIREARGGEYEIFSVSRQDGNWNIVKGNFTKKEMANMVLKKEIPAEKQPKKRENGLESLKKKEYEGTSKLTSNEKEGLENLPKRIKEKLKEKMQRGWTTETPPNIFSDFYDESEIKSVFNDEIKIYKLNPTKDFFDSLEKNSSHIIVKRGFCRSLTLAKKDSDTTAGQKRIVSHILSKCNHKFNNRLGLKYTAIK